MRRALLGALTAPPVQPALSIRCRFGLVVSRIADHGTFNGARVHAKPPRECRRMIRIPGEPERHRDDARLGKASRRHLRGFADQRDELFVARDGRSCFSTSRKTIPVKARRCIAAASALSVFGRICCSKSLRRRSCSCRRRSSSARLRSLSARSVLELTPVFCCGQCFAHFFFSMQT